MHDDEVISLQSRTVRNAVEKRLADIASSGGLSYDRLALEVLLLLPQDFVDTYTEVFHGALAGADGGAGARGEANARRASELKAAGRRRTGDRTEAGGKALTGATGRTSGRAARTTGKKYRRAWVIRNEDLLRVKERADKRLRQLAREMKLQAGGKNEERVGQARSRRACPTCKRFTDIEWRFCPTCGTKIEED